MEGIHWNKRWGGKKMIGMSEMRLGLMMGLKRMIDNRIRRMRGDV